ncbi:MAG: PAS domain S-box protein, partial [Anaerolineae bacterium]
ARAEDVAAGRADHVAVLDDLAERIGSFNQAVNAGIPVLAQGEPGTRAQLATVAMTQTWAEIDAIIAALDQLAADEQTELAAARATASDAAAFTSWLIVGVGGMALLIATGMVIVTIGSVIGPLVSLRATAKAITSGDLESRAKVSGPEEVASVARAFNEMTDALAAKTEEYIDTTNLTGDMIIRLDKDGRFTFLNDSACEILGKPREELLGTHAGAVVLPEDLEQAGQAVLEVIESKALVRAFESRLVTPMGIRVLEWNGCPLFDEQGEYAGIQLTGRDITDRKQAEESVTRTERRYRTLFEEAPVMYVIVRDQEGVPIIGDCNELFLSTLSYTRAEVLERPLADFYTPQSRAELLEGGGFQRGLEGRLVGEERELLARDGRVVRTLLRALPETDPEGFVFGTRAMYVDITERKQMEEVVRESEERLRTLVTNVPVILFAVDREGGLTLAEGKALGGFGAQPSEFVGRTVFELYGEKPEVSEYMQRAFAGESFTATFEVAGLVLETHHTPIRDQNGEVSGVIGVAIDITERKKIEDALLAKTKEYVDTANLTKDLIAKVDENGRWTFVNDAACQFFGKSREELLGTRPTDLVHPEDVEATIQVVQDGRTKTEPVTGFVNR